MSGKSTRCPCSLERFFGTHGWIQALLKCLKNTQKSREYVFLADWLGFGLLIR